MKSISNKKDFFSLDTVLLAKELLGKIIIVRTEKGIVGGYIVETEAYLGKEDEACHGYMGKRTPKVEALYQKAGTVYIYTMHTHKMLNIVSSKKDDPKAVLIRGVEPVIGLDIMEENRMKTGVIITNGPGKLTKAMEINDKFNKTEIEILNTKSYCENIDRNKKNIKDYEIYKKNIIYIDFKNYKIPKKIEVSPRIGISNKGKWTDELLRFYVGGNKYVSGMKKSEYNEKCWLDDC